MTETESWTIGRLLKWTADFFQEKEIDNPRLDAEVLLAAARGCQRIDLYAAFSEPAEEELRTAFRELVRRRTEGTPVAYLVGHREFYSMSFRVTPDVLIPRPETETLIVAALDCAKEIRTRTGENRSLKIADVGTGSGAIAITLAKHAEPCNVTAIDLSPAALEIAKENATNLNVSDKITWAESDLFSAVSSNEPFDLIASNPPYVSESEYEELPKDVKNHEPKLALVAGPNGTSVIERLIEQSEQKLAPGGWLLIEFGPATAKSVEQMFQQDSKWKNIKIHKDLAGLERIIEAQLAE